MQWPVRPEHQPYLVTLVYDQTVGPQGGYKAYAHCALPFGATKSVVLYMTISQGVCCILRHPASLVLRLNAHPTTKPEIGKIIPPEHLHM